MLTLACNSVADEALSEPCHALEVPVPQRVSIPLVSAGRPSVVGQARFVPKLRSDCPIRTAADNASLDPWGRGW